MYLVVDIGNSHTVTGLYRDNELMSQWRIKSDAKNTADEIAITYHSLFVMAGIDISEITGVVIASVVPTLQTEWIGYCRQHLINCSKDAVFVVNAQSIKSLISIMLKNPAEVGADRLVNGIGAWSSNPCKQIVLDFGTAITFDCITEKCEYQGGVILPGIAISLEALANKTAKLPHIDVYDAPETVIGKSTVHAMKSGILYGYGSMIDGLVAGIKDEMMSDSKEEFRVVATGGMSKLIYPFTVSIDEIDPMLTLKGLKTIYNKLVR